MPRECGGVRYRTSISLGETKLNKEQAAYAAQTLGRTEFLGWSYSLVSKNCNDFSKAFVHALGLSVQFPAWVNRLATVAAGMSCILPENIDRPLKDCVPVPSSRASLSIQEPTKPPRVASL